MNTNTATYCPEDNKLRLYVGRVPRDEYLKLRADGWTSTPKQSCDFVATWTPSRRDTALEYADIIDDEDQTPEDRAADRAERFGGYRDKRTAEATGRADGYDVGPQVHGYQSQARAERAAAKHDRLARYACDAWNKAEYWTSRTAGVIRHALYVSAPGVRMGRIKTLEAELRKYQKNLAEYKARWATWLKIANDADPTHQTGRALAVSGMESDWYKFTHPRNPEEKEKSLWSLLSDERDPITGAEAARMWLDAHTDPDSEEFAATNIMEWIRHYELRLAYENQMLEAQGGRAAHVEMIVGGFIGGRQIYKVNKSTVTGRVVSVHVKGPKVSGWTYKAQNVPGTDYALYQIDTERLAPGAYRAPTVEELRQFELDKAAAKEAAPKPRLCPLINPTDADAQRLQDLINSRERGARYQGDPSNKKSEVIRITQATYSANSKGAYARAETYGVCGDGELTNPESNLWSSERQKRAARIGPALCKVRTTGYAPVSVIILTDKPQKPFPPEVWEKYTPAAKVEQAEAVEA